MKSIAVNENLSISDQIEATDIEQLAQEGVQVIMCNRPDEEAAEQPSFSDIAAAAEAKGMEAIYIPFKTGEMKAEHVTQMRRLQDSGKRLHAFCRSGNRSFCLYAAAHASRGLPKEEILQQAEKAGVAVEKIIEPYYKGALNL
jgi:sulfide:quinone oxidoreductase